MGSLPVCTLERAGLVMLTVDLSRTPPPNSPRVDLGQKRTDRGRLGSSIWTAPLQTIFTTQLSNMGDATGSALASTPCCRQAIGKDWHPVLGHLYFTANRRD